MIKLGDECNKVPGVYCIKNTKNGKIYVGSSQNMRKRIVQHRYHLHRGSHWNNHLLNAFKLYGEGYFVVTVLEVAVLDQLDSREQYWLDALNPFGDRGYNIEPLSNRFGVAEETRKKLSDLAKDRWKNDRETWIEGVKRGTKKQKEDGHYQRMGDARRGVPRTEETKAKLSKSISESSACKEIRRKIAEARIGTKRTKESIESQLAHCKRFPIIQYDLEGNELARFRSARFMRTVLGFAPVEVGKACKNHSVYPAAQEKRFLWRYENDPIMSSDFPQKEGEQRDNEQPRTT